MAMAFAQPSLGEEKQSGGLLLQEPPALEAAGSDWAPLPWLRGPAACRADPVPAALTSLRMITFRQIK